MRFVWVHVGLFPDGRSSRVKSKSLEQTPGSVRAGQTAALVWECVDVVSEREREGQGGGTVGRRDSRIED